MYQLLYISSVRPEAARLIDPAAILLISRRNNARDGVTGLLFYDGRRFLQVLEGEEADVNRVYGRIRQDPRHHAIVVLSRQQVAARDFAEWSMAYQRRDEDAEATITRVAALSADAPPSVRGTFLGLAEMRRAA